MAFKVFAKNRQMHFMISLSYVLILISNYFHDIEKIYVAVATSLIVLFQSFLIQNMIYFFVNRIRLGTFKMKYKTILCGVFFKKSLRNLHCRFVLCSNDQIYGGDFQNFVAFSEYMNFTSLCYINSFKTDITKVGLFFKKGNWFHGLLAQTWL